MTDQQSQEPTEVPPSSSERTETGRRTEEGHEPKSLWGRTPSVVKASAAIVAAIAGALASPLPDHALWKAAETNSTSAARIALWLGASLLYEEGNYTPLMKAASKGSCDVVYLLADTIARQEPARSSYILEKHDNNNSTALFMAVGVCADGVDCSASMAEALLRAGANPNPRYVASVGKEYEGWTPLRWAKTQKPKLCGKVLEVLSKHGGAE